MRMFLNLKKILKMGCIKMKHKILFLMCGPAGSGKTTYVKKEMAQTTTYKCVHVSRDEVRAEFLKEDDKNIFKYEDDVFDEFCNRIKNALNEATDDIAVFADATHLSEKARNRVLDKLDLDGVDIIPVVFNLPLAQILAQNENRKGMGRAYVPRGTIRRMFYTFDKPTYNEKYTYKHILIVGDADKEYVESFM